MCESDWAVKQPRVVGCGQESEYTSAYRAYVCSTSLTYNNVIPLKRILRSTKTTKGSCRQTLAKPHGQSSSRGARRANLPNRLQGRNVLAPVRM